MIPSFPPEIFAQSHDYILGKNAVCPISPERLLRSETKLRHFGQGPAKAISLNHNILYFLIDRGLCIEYTPRPLRERRSQEKRITFIVVGQPKKLLCRLGSGLVFEQSSSGTSPQDVNGLKEAEHALNSPAPYGK
jgi:hypothetical protein